MSGKGCIFRLHEMNKRRDGESVISGRELGTVDGMLRSVLEMNDGNDCINVNVLNAIKNWL